MSDGTSTRARDSTLPPPCVLIRSRGSIPNAGNGASDVGRGGHPRSKRCWVALPRSPPISATLLHRVSIGGGSAPAPAGVLAGIVASGADVVRRRRFSCAAGQVWAATADDRVRTSGLRRAFRLLGCGVRCIEIFRRIGKSRLARYPGIVAGFRRYGGQPQCHRGRSLESGEPRVHQHGWSIKPVQNQKRRRAHQQRPKVDDWRDHKLPQRIEMIFAGS